MWDPLRQSTLYAAGQRTSLSLPRGGVNLEIITSEKAQVYLTISGKAVRAKAKLCSPVSGFLQVQSLSEEENYQVIQKPSEHTNHLGQDFEVSKRKLVEASTSLQRTMVLLKTSKVFHYQPASQHGLQSPQNQNDIDRVTHTRPPCPCPPPTGWSRIRYDIST